MKTKILCLNVLLIFGFLAGCQERQQPAQGQKESKTTAEIPAKSQPVAEDWKLVKSFGVVSMVYISPAGLKDKYFIAQVLHNLVDRKKTIQVMFFDDKNYTPLGFPMTDNQMLHWKATYNFNPNTGFERFVFIQVTDARSSPPSLREVEANIRPGYAE